MSEGGRIVGLGARVHLFARPAVRAAFTALFRDVLGGDVVERDFGLPYPILLVSFPDGSALSVEWTDLAPDVAETADDERAFRGPWLEFRATDPDLVLAALRSAGVPEFRHAGSAHAYFIAPGGQIFRILDVGYVGP